MTRSALFNLTVIVLLICAAVAGLLWWYVQRAELQLATLRTQLQERQTELQNLHQMTEAQLRLDQLTLDERETTQLALLRHLGLESRDVQFQVMGRESKPSGDTTLMTRRVSIQVEQPYSEQMALIDQLSGNGKLQIDRISIRKTEKQGMPDPTQVSVEGSIYSLEKQGEISATMVEGEALPAATPPQVAVAGAEGVSASMVASPTQDLSTTGVVQ